MTKESAIDILESYITTKVSDEGIFRMPEEDEIIHNEMSFDVPATISNQYTFGELVIFATKDFKFIALPIVDKDKIERFNK